MQLRKTFAVQRQGNTGSWKTSHGMRRTARIIVCALVLLIGFCDISYAQSGFGVITGAVYDSKGGAIQNAQISIINLATNVAQNAVTNSAGSYSSPPIIPGDIPSGFHPGGFRKTSTD